MERTNKIGNIDNKIKIILDDPYKFAKESPINEVADVLRQLSYHYYNTSEPLVPDTIYDLLRDELEERDPSNSVLYEVGSPVTKDAVELPFPMASLDKIKPTTDSLTTWLKKYKGPYVLSDKLDGVSGLLHKKDGKFKLYTRGDAITGQDITHLIPYLLKGKYNPNKIPDNTAIRCEIVMSRENFQKIKDQYKNPRNTVSGLVNSKNFSIDIAKITDCVGYSILHPKYKQEVQMKKLEEWGFPTVVYIIKDNIDNKFLSEYFIERRKESKYDVDGIVVIDSEKAYSISENNPDYGFAFKMVLLDQTAEVIVTDIKWKISKHGLLKPTIYIEPVELSGVTVEKSTAFNAKYIVDNKLGPGSKIKIIRSGDVIPYVLEVLSPSATGEPKMPSIPYEWNKTKVDIIVKDAHGAASDEINIKKLVSFFDILSVKYISEGIIRKLVENGYKTVYDIIDASVEDIVEIEGIGSKLWNKISNNIKEAFISTDMATLMHASNIFGFGLGSKKIKLITNTYPDILDVNWSHDEMVSKLVELNGFDTITAIKFANNINEFKKFYTKLNSLKGIDMSHLKNKPNALQKSALFSGMKIVFTGFRDEKLEKFITENGGSMTTSVSKNTSIVVYKEGETSSSKYIKAKELKVNLMTEKEFRNKYNIK